MSDLKDKLEEILNEASEKLRYKEVMESIGEQVREDVIKRTRLGSGVLKPQGPATPLNALKPSYVKQRQSWKAKGILSSLTTPKKSNLTKTGQMLDSLTVDAKPGSVQLGFSNDFAAQKASWVTDGGRPFMFLTDREFRKMMETLRKITEEIIKTVSGK